MRETASTIETEILEKSPTKGTFKKDEKSKLTK